MLLSSYCFVPSSGQGGRNSKDPILREDIFLLKVKALGSKSRSKKKAKEVDEQTVDPFAPEYGMDTWHRSQQQLAKHRVSLVMYSAAEAVKALVVCTWLLSVQDVWDVYGCLSLSCVRCYV